MLQRIAGLALAGGLAGPIAAPGGGRMPARPPAKAITPRGRREHRRELTEKKRVSEVEFL